MNKKMLLAHMCLLCLMCFFAIAVAPNATLAASGCINSGKETGLDGTYCPPGAGGGPASSINSTFKSIGTGDILKTVDPSVTAKGIDVGTLLNNIDQFVNTGAIPNIEALGIRLMERFNDIKKMFEILNACPYLNNPAAGVVINLTNSLNDLITESGKQNKEVDFAKNDLISPDVFVLKIMENGNTYVFGQNIGVCKELKISEAEISQPPYEIK